MCKETASNKTSLVVSAMNDHLVVSPECIRRGHLTLRRGETKGPTDGAVDKPQGRQANRGQQA